MQKIPFFVRKDIDGFFGLFIDNLVNLLIIAGTLSGLFHMPASIVYGRVIPGAAIAIIIGNIFYTGMARKLARKEGRRNVTALPYGISTPIMFAYLFLVIGPVYWKTHDAHLAWKVGVAAAFIGGVIEFLGAFVGNAVRKYTPRAALLGTLAGIAITWIAMKPTLGIWENPQVGFLPLAIILIGFIARIALPLKIPAGFLAILLGSALAWAIGFMKPDAPAAAVTQISFYCPVLVLDAIKEGIKEVAPFLAVVIPMGIYNFLETMQNVESASAAGDRYNTRSAMMMDGVGTMVGALFGSCFPTTVYIGHPGWKAVGARCGYSLINGVAIFLIGIFGLLILATAVIPQEVAYCILLYIALVIGAQAFQTTPKLHAPAVVIAFIPHIANYVKSSVDQALYAAQTTADKVGMIALAAQGLSYKGLASLGYGAIVTGMLLGAITAFLIDKRFRSAAIYAFSAAILAFFGVIHAPEMAPAAAPWHALGYLLFSLLFCSLWLFEKTGHKLEVMKNAD
jgi:AGZA family xanthine/uracil permease-like MFS transporter